MVLIISCCHSSITPVTPPTTKFGINANDQSIGTVKRIRPLYSVNNQLKILTPVGIEIAIVEIEKNELTAGPAPIVKKW